MAKILNLQNPSLKLGFLFFVGLFFLYGSLSARFFPALERKEKFLPPPAHLHRFTFGYHELTADMLWVRALQDFDYCEEQVATNICRSNSWLYQILDTITNLSPKYRLAHALGPLSLTVIINDIEGASKLFDKAVAAYPNDWRILYRAFYQAYYEEKNMKKAADLAKRSADNGGPPWLYSTAVGLISEQDGKAVALELFRELEAMGISDEAINRAKKKLKISE